MMNITITGLAMGFLLILVPICLFYKYSIDWLKQAILAFAKLVSFLFLSGIFLFYLLKWDSMFVDLVWIVLMAALSVGVTNHRARLNSERMFVPVMAGVLLSTLVVGAWTVLALAGLQGLGSTRYVVAIAGLLIGMMVESNAVALSAYYAGLHHHGELYKLLLSNGAGKGEALNYFVRRAIQKGATIGLRKMSSVVLYTCPSMLYVMILCGEDAFTAVAFQIIIMIAALAAVMLSLIITLYISRRYLFDDYSRLRDDVRP